MGNDRKQPHFTELIFESTEKNVTIPPRDSAEALLPKPPAPSVKKTPAGNTVQLQLWEAESQEPEPEPVTTTEGQFVQRARELEQRKEPAALFVPFKSYWPTYGHMTGSQSRWYFYWRDEARQGRYPKTDLSYIFLHVYELINGVGWNEPSEGYRQLCQLWEAYRDTYKRLDQYMGNWLADFSFVHHVDAPLSTIVARSRGLAGDLAELELMRCLSSAPEQLTFAALTIMSDYDIGKSKFYTGAGKDAAELYIPQVVALIDAYVTRKHGMNLVQMFPPGPPVLRERYLFRSAVYDISLYGYSVLVPVVRISKSAPLRSLITRLFRLAENKLRELLGFRGRLKGVKVDADMDDLVTRFLRREFRKKDQVDKGPAVVINQEKLERLQSDSEIVRTLLTVEEPVYIDDRLETAAGSDAGGEETAQAVSSTDMDADMDDNDTTDGSNSDRDSESDRANVSSNTDTIAGLAARDAQTGAADTGAGTDWTRFEAALSPLQREAVFILVSGGGLTAVQNLAAGGGTMPELLVEGINELAVELLGDLLIDGDEIIEEYDPMLQYFKR